MKWKWYVKRYKTRYRAGFIELRGWCTLWTVSNESGVIKNLLEEKLCDMKSRIKSIVDNSPGKKDVKWCNQWFFPYKDFMSPDIKNYNRVHVSIEYIQHDTHPVIKET